MRLPMLGRAYAEMGETERAKEIYGTLLEVARTEFVVYWNLAVIAVGMGTSCAVRLGLLPFPSQRALRDCFVRSGSNA